MSCILNIFIINYRSESRWTNGAVGTFIGIILTHLCILLIITLIGGIFKLLAFIKRRKKNKSKSEKDQSRSKIDEDSRMADDMSSSGFDKLPKINFSIPNGTNMFIVRPIAYMD